MRTIKQCGAQGDVLFRRVSAVPAGFEKRERKGAIVVSHSETGHHHVVDSEGAEYWESKSKPLVCYLQMGSAFLDCEHLRPYDTHETIRLDGNPGDIWECRRQRERSPEGWRRVQD